MPMTIEKAGAIILSEQDPTKVLLLYRAREQDFTFPKGHVEEGEYWLDSMDREVEEETGLTVEVLADDLPDMEYAHPDHGHSVVHFAIVRSLDDQALKTEFEGDSLTWMSFDHVAEKLTYDNLREYWHKVLPEAEGLIAGLESR